MDIVSVKTVIRCCGIDSSRAFYVDLLGLSVVQEWDGPEGKGCIVTPAAGSGGFIELSEVARAHDGYREAFSLPFSNDKADLQLRVSSLDAWTRKLDGRWPFEGNTGRAHDLLAEARTGARAELHRAHQVQTPRAAGVAVGSWASGLGLPA